MIAGSLACSPTFAVEAQGLSATTQAGPSGKPTSVSRKVASSEAEPGYRFTGADGVQVLLSSKEVASGTLLSLQLGTAQRTLQPTEKIKGEFEGISFPFFPFEKAEAKGTYGALLGIPYERVPGPGVVRIQIGSDPGFEIPIQIVDGNYGSEKLRVNARRVNPTRKKDLIRIQRDLKDVGAIYSAVTEKKYWDGAFLFPIESSFTSLFGTKRLYNGKLKNFHPGLDLKAPMNTPVLSPAAGRVVLAKNLFYTGNTVMLDHGYGLITLYAHMNKILVKTGQEVAPHDQLGLSGMTGRVSGPHLHWQAVVHRVKVNPIGLTQVVQ